MDGRRFYAMVRNVLGAARSRRGLLGAVGAGAAHMLAENTEARDRCKARLRRNRSKRRKRANRRKVHICHNETLIRVGRKVAEAHLQHGDQFGSCEIPPGDNDETCSSGTAPCNSNLISCGEGCFCFLTTSGATFCASDIECPADLQCQTDNDCADHFGDDGWACVPTLGNCLFGCKSTGCAQKCQA